VQFAIAGSALALGNVENQLDWPPPMNKMGVAAVSMFALIVVSQHRLHYLVGES
jgi:hypothetical protein